MFEFKPTYTYEEFAERFGKNTYRSPNEFVSDFIRTASEGRDGVHRLLASPFLFLEAEAVIKVALRDGSCGNYIIDADAYKQWADCVSMG